MTKTLVFRRLSALAGLIGILGASLSGCGGGAASTSGNQSGGGTITPPPYNRAACAANPHIGNNPRWTVLIYLNAANNLDSFSLPNVAQMMSVGSDSNLNIVVQWKQANVDGDAPSFVGTRRYYIRQHNQADINAVMNGNIAPLNSDRLADPSTNVPTVNGTSNMGDYHTLQSFVQWGEQNYPADNIALVIWDHGSAGLPPGGYSTANARAKTSNSAQRKPHAVSEDDATMYEIETYQLSTALAGLSHPLDILIFDCSLEQTVEVEYQVASVARIMVGSEESPPGAGYPYNAWLSDLKANGTTNCIVGYDIVKDFVAAYPTDTDITQSVIDLSQMQNVANALNAFGLALYNHRADQASVIANARTNAQNYEYPEQKDLYHYAALIQQTALTSDLRQAAANMQAAILGANAAVITSGHGNYDQANSNGMAAYIQTPQAFDATDYPNLALATAAPNWALFLPNQTQ